MTDARLQGEWLAALRFASLSDVGWRVFCGAIMWSAEQGTDGAIPERFLRSLHPSLDPQPDAYAELEAAGMWSKVVDGYQLIGWADRNGLGQSTAAQVRAYREGSRSRQQRYRERLRDAPPDHVGGAAQKVASEPRVTRNATRDVTPNVGSGSIGGLSTTEGAYVSGDVTRNAPPSRYCHRHPNGSDGQPCGACRDARLDREAWEREQIKPTPTSRPPKAGECEHRSHPTSPGYCALCGDPIAGAA